MLTLARYLPGVSVVVSVATSFISTIEPIAGMWNLSDAAPTSTVLPDESAKERSRSFSPLLSSPVSLASVTVRPPAVVDLIVFALLDEPDEPVEPDGPDLLPEHAAAIRVAIETMTTASRVPFFILISP